MSISRSSLEIGTVIRSFRDDTTPPKVKYWIVVGISGNGIGLASVLINSRVNPFLARNPELSKAQYRLDPDSRELVEYSCFADCSQIKEKGLAEIEELLERRQNYIKGMLYPEEIDEVMALIRGCRNISPAIKARYGFH